MLTEIDIAPFAVSDMWAATVDGVVQTDSISASQAAADILEHRCDPSNKAYELMRSLRGSCAHRTRASCSRSNQTGGEGNYSLPKRSASGMTT